MPELPLLGPFEELVLLSVVGTEEGAYGMRVRREVERRSGRSVSIGAVYSALERLEAKGYVSSARTTDTTDASVRRGRARRFFRLEEPGVEALVRSRELRDAAWKGIDPARLSRARRNG